MVLDSRRLRRRFFLLPISSSRFLVLLPSLCFVASAQEAAPPALPLEPLGTSPDAAPALGENAPTEATPAETAPAETAPIEAEKPQVVGRGSDLPAPAAVPSRLVAERLSYQGGTVIAEGSAGKLVRFETSAGILTALRVQLDTLAQTVEASGQVRLEREVQSARRVLQPRILRAQRRPETTREILVGDNLRYDFKAGQGTLDDAALQLASLSISADSLRINGRRYTARDVVLRPGALSEADRRIYGTPPLNLRANSISASVGGAPGSDNIAVRGGGLFFKNTRILPVPGYVFRAGLDSGGGEQSAFQLTPGLSFNTADRILATTQLAYPLTSDPQKLSVFADLGLSQRIGLRGGIGLRGQTGVGTFQIRARRSDVVQTQLTNRIELDRSPEVLLESVPFATFPLPGGRRAGFSLSGSYGDYAERRIGDGGTATKATRAFGRLLFTTRLKAVDGPFLRLFATTARYGGADTRYGSRGFELGYEGTLSSRVRGQILLRSSSLSGQTPFRFDEIQIARELRTTFDVSLTPRYLLPIDLRYDLSRQTFRDATFGLLRSYKVFAYGLVYQSARRDLRLEVRQGF